MSDARATSFGAEAENYEAARPDYPFEAVAWMLERLPEGARRLADVGAGTGKLTRVVVSAGNAEVVAVDPDAAMLAELREQVPSVPTFLGTAESLPLPDAAVDAVVLGQAWHWVDPVAASAEIGRVVRPGGTLGLIWNVRDSHVDWVRRLTEIMHASAAEQMLDALGLKGDATIDVPYVTRAFRALRA
ncbi:class I SAM-dependent methyltransferase [Microbacterium sp. USHLN186]|uniref:class I SAM-dependent methyltransferase n=1 Tax=Microbacterium sp. USHLN186 TaxID=3081286 RepID=UPI00301942AD